MEQPRVFFSYSRDDSEFVLKLASELREQGVNLWLDQLDIAAGERWDSAIEKALETCETLIVVLSPTSVGSVNVMDEVSYALESGKRVVPVLARACDIPFRLRRVQHINFVDDYDRGFKHLMRGFRSASEGADALPAAPAAAPSPPRDKADRASGAPDKPLGKRLGLGLAGGAVLALVLFLVLRPGQKEGGRADDAGKSPHEIVPNTPVDSPGKVPVDPPGKVVDPPYGNGEMAVITDQKASTGGESKVLVTGTNATDLPLNISWIDYNGVEGFNPNVIPPSDSQVMGTSYSGNVFRVRIDDPKCDGLKRVEVVTFQLGKAPEQILKVTPEMITEDMRQRAASREGC